MIQAFYSGSAALTAHQNSVDVIANNISNINTTAYKTKQEDFSSLLYRSMVRPETTNSATLLAGAGSAVNGVQTDMSAGTALQTQNANDYFIDGQGFFAVRGANGNTFYTRDGSFQKVSGQNGYFLGTSDGLSVLDGNGNPIAIGAAGAAAQPGVFNFSNSSGLIPAGDNLYTAGALSGAATPGTAVVRSGMLESSNVELSSQMVDLISSQRGYQLSSGVVSTANNIESMINGISQG